MKLTRLYVVWIPFFLSAYGYGQDCNIVSKANDINPDQLCSPVEVVTWEVSYVGVNHAGTTVEIYFDWDDGYTETVPAIELDATTSEWGAISSHTYISNDDICNHLPVASLVVNGVRCTSSSQEQIVTVWDNDNTNGGRVNASPNVYPVCVGSGATMHFEDNTLFNCVPPQENDVPNDRTRWIQWVYGTNITMSGSPVMVDGVVRTYPYEGEVIMLPGPVTGSDEISLPITVADDNLVGEEFEVELRYWNYCNPYPDSDPVTDRSVIRIVDIPDATIDPVDTLCEFESNLILHAATRGGTWSGPGIVNERTGEFSPRVAGNGTHTILYEVTDDNGCSNMDTEEITVRPGPDGTITPAGPFCESDPPYDLEGASEQGTWSGPGIVNSSTGLFDPSEAGPGTHLITFVSVPDASGCTGEGTVEITVLEPPSAEFLTPDSAWCQSDNNHSSGEIQIYGSGNSWFDLVLDMQGTRDTLSPLSAGTFNLSLENEVDRNTYALVKITEHYGDKSCEADLADTLVMVVHPNPVLELTATYDDLCSPVEVDFETVEGYQSYSWNLGDGSWHFTQNNRVSYTYLYDYHDVIIDIVEGDTVYGVPGTDTVFHIQLIAESNFGCTDSLEDSIRIYPSPEADFFANPMIQDYPDSVIYLVNLSSPGTWSYAWDFGDGSSDAQKDPGQHVYREWGLFDIILTTYSPFCRDSATRTVEIKPPPPRAKFMPDSVGCSPLEITFTNQSVFADTYIWDFDDGQYSSEPSPTHRFWESKEHHVKLTAYGPSGVDSVEQIVLVYPNPQAVFEAYPQQVKRLNQLVKFMNNSQNGSRYLWDFGDGDQSEDENPSHTYKEPGNYTISLYVWSDHECTDSLVRKNLIIVVAGEGTTKFPNAFVWNGSGPTGGYWEEGAINNTVFHPHLENAVDLHMIIYTRWGEKLYESNEVYKGWDGYVNTGELVPPGVYIYKAWVTYVDGRQEILAGDVTFLH